MSDFTKLRDAISKQLLKMSQHDLWVADVDKDKMWEVYLESFPPGTNEIFRERTEHDCQCCKQFIRNYGNIVTIIEDRIVSIWDIPRKGISYAYDKVSIALSRYVLKHPIKDIFLAENAKLGTHHNYQIINDEETLRWDHFYCEVPQKFVSRDIPKTLGDYRTKKEVFQRCLDEVPLEVTDTVLELISQDTLYRGQEFKAVLQEFRKYQNAYEEVCEKDNSKYCWKHTYSMHGSLAKIRNSAIGTLLVDLAEGKELDHAVTSFESKVAPANYKRPTAIITKSMIDSAENAAKELGYENSFSRRYAITEDLTINNVLFANRDAKESMSASSVFSDLKKDVKVGLPKSNKTPEIPIDTFIKDILPNISEIELMLEPRHCKNLMSLIAPVDPDAKNMLKWGNNFSWSYIGDLTDSIKDKVRKAGGNVEGVLRCSLSWYNTDDLDIHVLEPNGDRIMYNNKRSRSSGFLDVDMNVNLGDASRDAVENITWTDKSKMYEGEYQVIVNNFTHREATDVGFDVELEFDGKTYSFHYDKMLRDSRSVDVVKFEFTRKNGIKILDSIPSSHASKEMWGIHTGAIQHVSMIMNSPNHWDGEETGNKHWFFILKDCKNDGQARGFFNEFLREDLREHRKVFEVLGNKMRVPESENQLSGVGFSSTKRDSVFCRVIGNFSRTIKIIF